MTPIDLAAIVVTFHPDEGFGERASRLLAQFGSLIMIDNGSSPDELKRIREIKQSRPERVVLVENRENLGVATAFNRGTKEAAALGFRFAVLFDHDSKIMDGFVTGLLKAHESAGDPERLAILGARYEDIGPAKDRTPFVINPAHPLWLERDAVISSGSLVSIPIWQRLGGLNEALFIDYVDDEYCLRARKAGCRVLQTTETLFCHRIGNSTSKRFLWKTVYPLNQPAFRWYHVARNFEYVATRYGFREPGWALNRGFQLVKRMGKMLLFEKGRPAKLAAIALGLKDGLRLREARLPIRTIGIALAAYEPNPKHLLEQMKSLQAQTFRDWICHVSCDSPLGEIRALPEFAPFFSDPRFRWSENPSRLGHLRNFEKAIQAVAALGVDAIACCDQDDVWFPEKLEASVRELTKLGPLGLVFCDMKLMDAEGEISERTAWDVERRGIGHCGTFDLLVRNVVPGTGMLMDAELARKFPRIPEGALYHDHWYPLVASKVGRIRPIHRPLYAYRLHSANVMGLTPYSGFFSHQPAIVAGTGKTADAPGFSGMIAKCRRLWRRSRDFALSAQSEGLSLSPAERYAFIRRSDLGFLLLAYGLIRIPTDPALARACVARAIGKLSDLIW